MKHALHGHRRPALAFVLVTAMGCSAAPPKSFTDADAKAVRDTVTALDNATNLAVDRLDCAAGFDHVGDREPMFVSNTFVARTRPVFLQACQTMMAKRTGAVFAIDTLTAQALSPDAAYVVREGVYTISMKDGSSERQYLIMTSIWARQADGWKMVHLHESYRPLTP